MVTRVSFCPFPVFLFVVIGPLEKRIASGKMGALNSD